MINNTMITEKLEKAFNDQIMKKPSMIRSLLSFGHQIFTFRWLSISRKRVGTVSHTGC